MEGEVVEIVDCAVVIVASRLRRGSDRAPWGAQGVTDRAMVRLTAIGCANDMLRLVVCLEDTNRARIVNGAVGNGPERRQHDQSDEAGRPAEPGQSHKQFQISILAGCCR